MKIVTLGDSITKGVRSGVKPEETFAARLEAELKAEGIATEVVNVGIGGERTDQALKRLDDVISRRPRVVTVMYGTNDSYVDKGAAQSRLALDVYRANLKRIVDSLRARDRARPDDRTALGRRRFAERTGGKSQPPSGTLLRGLPPGGPRKQRAAGRSLRPLDRSRKTRDKAPRVDHRRLPSQPARAPRADLHHVARRPKHHRATLGPTARLPDPTRYGLETR